MNPLSFVNNDQAKSAPSNPLRPDPLKPPMTKPQFDIRTLLILTALVGFGLSFAIQSETWLVALLVTSLLANVAAVIVALAVYVLLPLLEDGLVRHEPTDTD